MAQTQLRFGILGCANIARKVSRAMLLSPNTTISAIGSRSLEKAVTFALENHFPKSDKVCGTYDAVLDDPDVDAVYIPLPTSLHLRWAVLAAEKNKHVLLEKPVALNVIELDTILAACESSGVQFMDATMWMHHPRTTKLKQLLSDEQRFGQLKSVSHSSVYISISPYTMSYVGEGDFLKNDIRVNLNLEPLGALRTIGWYCIRAILWAHDYELPNTVTAFHDPEYNESGAILSCGASLNWKTNGKVATFYCSFLSNLCMDILARVRSGEAEPEKKWPVISRKTQLVIDAVLASIKNGFVPVEVGC